MRRRDGVPFREMRWRRDRAAQERRERLSEGFAGFFDRETVGAGEYTRS